jgi:2-keto-myo-inositol isomerase
MRWDKRGLSAPKRAKRIGGVLRLMKPCISQATTLNNSFETDPSVYSRGGWPAVELWLTKLESFLESHSLADARELFDRNGVKPVAAAAQGGLLLSQGEERVATWQHFERRLECLGQLGVATMILAPDFARKPRADDFGRAATALGEAAEIARRFGVRLALEFQSTSPLCSCLETAAALVAQSGATNAGVCFDVFHYYTGPSKFEDMAYLTPNNLAWVQVCDLSGTPRELAGDRDRILPGEGDFQLGPIVDQLGSIGYDGFVSLEVLNPHLWQASADRVADFGYRAVCRVLGRWNSDSSELAGGP